MSARIVDREQKKLKIMGSAFNVIQQKGYANTKIADIAAAANIAEGTIYEYFRSKDELLASALETMVNLSQEYVYKELDKVDDPEKKLKLFLRLSVSFFTEAADIFRIFMELVRTKQGEDDSQARESLLRSYEEMIDRVEAILKEGIKKGVFKRVDTRSTALLLVCIRDALQFPYALDKKIVDVKKMSKVIEDMVLSYLT